MQNRFRQRRPMLQRFQSLPTRDVVPGLANKRSAARHLPLGMGDQLPVVVQRGASVVQMLSKSGQQLDQQLRGVYHACEGPDSRCTVYPQGKSIPVFVPEGSGGRLGSAEVSRVGTAAPGFQPPPHAASPHEHSPQHRGEPARSGQVVVRSLFRPETSRNVWADRPL